MSWACVAGVQKVLPGGRESTHNVHANEDAPCVIIRKLVYVSARRPGTSIIITPSRLPTTTPNLAFVQLISSYRRLRLSLEMCRPRYCRQKTNIFSERKYGIARPSVVCLSVVCNVRAPYSAGWNFRQCFFAIWYLGHRLAFTENFTEIVLGKHLRLEIWTQVG